MSELTPLQTWVAEENRIADAIDVTNKRIQALNNSLPELREKVQRGVAAHRESAKSPYPTEAINAAAQVEAEIANLKEAVATFEADLAVARKASKLAADQQDTSDDYADAAMQIELARPLLAVCKRMMARHERRGASHRSANGFPEITEERLESLSAFLRRETTAPVKPKLPSTHVLTQFIRAWPGSQMSSGIGQTSAYAVGEIAAFPRRTAAILEAAGFIVAAPKEAA